MFEIGGITYNMTFNEVFKTFGLDSLFRENLRLLSILCPMFPRMKIFSLHSRKLKPTFLLFFLSHCFLPLQECTSFFWIFSGKNSHSFCHLRVEPHKVDSHLLTYFAESNIEVVADVQKAGETTAFPQVPLCTLVHGQTRAERNEVI